MIDDYTCQSCGATMFVPDGEDPLEADVRYCGPCAIGEIERLRAIVDKLPKTADGATVVPGMDVFRCGGRLRSRAMMHYEPWSSHCWEDCVCGPSVRSSYSTREAAEKARDQ